MLILYLKNQFQRILKKYKYIKKANSENKVKKNYLTCSIKF